MLEKPNFNKPEAFRRQQENAEIFEQEPKEMTIVLAGEIVAHAGETVVYSPEIVGSSLPARQMISMGMQEFRRISDKEISGIAIEIQKELCPSGTEYRIALAVGEYFQCRIGTITEKTLTFDREFAGKPFTSSEQKEFIKTLISSHLPAIPAAENPQIPQE